MRRVLFVSAAVLLVLMVSCASDDPIGIVDEDALAQSDAATDDLTGDTVLVPDEVADDLLSDDPATDDLPTDETMVDEMPDVDNAVKPPAPTNFTGKIEDTTIVLSWQNPAAQGFQEVRLVRGATAVPAGPEDGETLYAGTDETYTFAGPVITGNTYYFALFAFYGAAGYSDGIQKVVTSCYSKLDVVFVMDVSTTMEHILQTLHDDMENVWNAALEIETTPRFGLVVFVDDVTAANDGAFYETPEAVQGGFADWIQFIKDYGNKNTRPETTGYNTDMPENTLDALATAVEDFPWRDINKTLRIVIHTTDDTFLEKPAKFKSNVQVQHTYDETVDLLKGAQVRVGSFAAKTAWRPTIEEPDNEKDVTPGYFVDYKGKPAIPATTGGAAYDLNLVGKPAPEGISMGDAVNDFIKDRLCLPY